MLSAPLTKSIKYEMHQNEIDGADSKLLDLSIKMMHGIESPKSID